MARDDDIFKRLKKEKPLIKRKDLAPLTSRDFTGRSKFDIKIEKSKSLKRSRPKVSSAVPADAPKPARGTKVQKSRDVEVFGGEKQKERPRREQAQQPQRPRREQIRRPVRHSYQDNQSLETAIPAAFTPAGLDGSIELKKQRGDRLSFRHELKYYINYRDYILLKNTLKAVLPLDKHSGETDDYYIRSLYFDDVYNTALTEKLEGSDNRKKYRIRIYNFREGQIKFEKKIKYGQYIAKQAINLSRDECDRLVAGDFYALEARAEPLAKEIYLQMKNNCLKPCVIVDYRREAYISPIENVRITFDKDLKAGLWIADIFDKDAPTMPVIEKGLMVLEVKFDKYLPAPLKAVINNIDTAQRSAISKYVLCRGYE